MPLEKFIPLSPDPYITQDSDMKLAQFGHLNTIVDYLNIYVAADSLQLEGVGPLSATARYITDSAGNLSSLAISTGNIGIGTTLPVAKLQVNGVTALSNADLTGYNLYSAFNIVRNGATSMAMDRYTGAPHFNFRAAGGTIASPSTQVGELGNIGWWSHSGTAFNRNVLILAQAQDFVGGLAQTQRLSIGMGQSGSGSDYYYEMVNGNSYFGAGASGSTPTARVQIKGGGSTSATTSLLVQNSATTRSLEVLDDATTIIGQPGYGVKIHQQTVGGTPVFAAISGDTATLPTTTNYGFFVSSNGNYAGLNAAQGLDLRMYGTTRLQVAFNTGNIIIQNAGTFTDISSARLQVNSTTQGFLPPRMTTAQKNLIATPAIGLQIFDTDLNRPCFYNGAWVTL